MFSLKKFHTREIWCRNKKDQRIYGKAYIPNEGAKFPLVIFSHGYGYNMSFLEAEELAGNGIAVYEFDFCGGSPYSRSNGNSLEMSVMSEADDLEAVLDELKKQDFVDENRIYLSGGSQGGFVSIVVGVRYQEDVQGLILYCPALVIQDFEKVNCNGKRMPPQVRFGNMTISRKYVDDLKGYDVFCEMEKFKKPVLYYHGDRDELVPLDYALEAQKHFPDVKLTILENTGHMLNYGNENLLLSEMIKFIQS